MATPESITELWTNFKSLVKKVTYDKTEVDNKLSQKANNTLSTVSANGLMSSNDKTKLDGIESGANKTVVDTSISPTSTNPTSRNIRAVRTADTTMRRSVRTRSSSTSGTTIRGGVSRSSRMTCRCRSSGCSSAIRSTRSSSTSRVWSRGPMPPPTGLRVPCRTSSRCRRPVRPARLRSR